MLTDVLYLARDRKIFTEQSFRQLVANTDWSLVHEFVVYEDGSRKVERCLRRLVREVELPCPIVYRETDFGSPVAVMCDYLKQTETTFFAKIDNDIIVPPGWLGKMLEVMEPLTWLDLLGMEAGMGGRPWEGWDGSRHAEMCSHIGGVGLMRVDAFRQLPFPIPNGRFGFTEWQHRYHPARAWITPDLRMVDLSRVPFEPWRSISLDYRKAGIQREWPFYPPEMGWYWDWWRATDPGGKL